MAARDKLIGPAADGSGLNRLVIVTVGFPCFSRLKLNAAVLAIAAISVAGIGNAASIWY